MVDRGVDVGIEPIFTCGGLLPTGFGLFLQEADLGDGLARLEAVLPWHHDAHRGTILVGQNMAVQTKAQQGQWVHGFVNTKAFNIGPLEHTGTQARHLRPVGQGHKFNEFCVARGLHSLDQFGQGVAHPRHNHGPTFNTAQSVNALFHRRQLQQCVDVNHPGLVHLTFDRDRPGSCLQGACVACGVGLVSAKFVEIVVARHIGISRGLFHGDGRRHRAFDCR